MVPLLTESVDSTVSGAAYFCEMFTDETFERCPMASATLEVVVMAKPL